MTLYTNLAEIAFSYSACACELYIICLNNFVITNNPEQIVLLLMYTCTFILIYYKNKNNIIN